jgi:hypothetical protein
VVQREGRDAARDAERNCDRNKRERVSSGHPFQLP